MVEAGFVAIVLCIGVALAAAGALSALIRGTRTAAQVVRVGSTALRPRPDVPVVLRVPINRPPLSLRI